MSTGLTLAFELAALRRLTEPALAVEDARGWSEHVGVVSDRPPYVLTKFTREQGLRNDFPPEPAPAVETLDHMRTHHDTERYVLVTAETDTAVDGWETLPVTEAADRADWELAPAAERASADRTARDDAATNDATSPGSEDSVGSDWP